MHMIQMLLYLTHTHTHTYIHTHTHTPLYFSSSFPEDIAMIASMKGEPCIGP